MMAPPSGTVAFLFTDIEGSTRLWEADPSRMSVALARHDALLREAIETAGGVVFKTVGDAFCAVFAQVPAALRAALAAQQALLREAWPSGTVIAARMAVHWGAAEVRGDDYFGPTLNRAARLLAIGHGRQVLVSDAAAAALEHLPDGCALQDRGRHRLKDLHEPEHVFELRHAVLPAGLPPLRSLSTHPNNLPHQATTFVGRAADIARLRTLLDEARLVTLTGAGGAGKTRLAIQAAAETLEAFPDGVWLVELAALQDAALLPATVAATLKLQTQGAVTADVVATQLAARRLLLVLDNAEHLVDPCATLAHALLRACPHVVVLVTSRQPLQVHGEVLLRVPSLGVPPARGATAAQVEAAEAVRLFVERARLHAPAFALDASNAATLASLCRRLDGIPLAIELAAARMRALSLEEIDRRLDQRFRLLTNGPRTALPRQQTLRSLIDWSYDLLPPAERALLRRLAVFSGGHTLEAAEAVCAGDGVDALDMLDLVASLVDKSLVVAEVRGPLTRYRMLETVREYALERLREQGDVHAWQRRHFEHFLGFARDAEPQLAGPAQQQWLERLEAEHDNLRTALAWASTPPGDAAAGLHLATLLWRFWFVRGHASEGRAYMTGFAAACSREPPSVDRAKALTCAGMFAHQLGDYRAATAHYEESLAMRRVLDDRPGIAASLNNLATVAYEQGDPHRARCMYEESLALAREAGNPEATASVLGNLAGVALALGDYEAAQDLHRESLALRRRQGNRKAIAASLGNLGDVHACMGDYAAARPLLEEAASMLRELGDAYALAQPLNDLGTIHADEGDYDGARALFMECLERQHEIGNVWGLAAALEGLAQVALGRGASLRAACIWGAAERLREDIGVPLNAVDSAHRARLVEAARAACDDADAFERAWQEGRGLSVEAVVELARHAP